MKLPPIERSELERYLSLYDFSAFLNDKTFLITGSRGLCGTGVIKWLLSENLLHGTNTKIIASTRSPKDVPPYVEPWDNITFCEFGKEAEACKDTHIDYIIHMAAPTKNSFFKTKPVETLRTIIDATENMLEFTVKTENCIMIYLSSEEVYGLEASEQPVDEAFIGTIDSLNTRSCYPLGKKAAELLCYTYFAEYGADVRIIRPTSIQGLFQDYHEERLINEVLRCIVERKNLLMKSAGTTKKCIIYTLDVVSAIFKVLFKGTRGEVYNVSNPDTFMSAKDFASHLFQMFAPQVSIEFSLEDVSISDGYLPKRTLVQNISKLQRLGWEPETGLERIYEIDIQRFAKSRA